MVQGTLETLASQLDQLHPVERARYDLCKYARRKESYLLGRLSAKAALAELTGFNDAAELLIDTGVFNFPVVKCAALSNQQVSISHCEGISISVAFAEAHPMGIDIEQVTEKHQEVMRNQLTTKEVELLRRFQLDDIRGYTLIWSIKESLSKVIRTGLTIDFSLLEVNALSVKNIGEYACTFSQFGQYQAVSCFLGDYVVSITLPKKSSVNFGQTMSFFWNLNENRNAY
jgi:4'-phosphopantetheinyl transferase EntD